MARKARLRFWIECGLTILTAALFVLTLSSREWIEEIFRVEPDAGSGTVEWGIVAVLGVASVGFALLTRAEWRRTAAST